MERGLTLSIVTKQNANSVETTLKMVLDYNFFSIVQL